MKTIELRPTLVNDFMLYIDDEPAGFGITREVQEDWNSVNRVDLRTEVVAAMIELIEELHMSDEDKERAKNVILTFLHSL